MRCCFCGKYLAYPDVMYYESRTCHRQCYLNSSEKEKLFVFIKGLYGISEIGDKIKSQVENFMSSIDGLTFSDIKDALCYFHSIKGNPIVSRDTIGIVPKIYEEAKSYFFLLKIRQNSFKKNYPSLNSIDREKITVKKEEKKKKLYDIDSIAGRG